MAEVRARPPHALVRFRQESDGFPAPLAALLAPGDARLPLQVQLGHPEGARIGDLAAIGECSERL